jgi:hypothetical protein
MAFLNDLDTWLALQNDKRTFVRNRIKLVDPKTPDVN